MTIKKISKIIIGILIVNVIVFLIMTFLFTKEGANKYDQLSAYIMLILAFITSIVIAGFNYFRSKDELNKWQKALFGISTILAFGITIIGVRALIAIPEIVKESLNVHSEGEKDSDVMQIDTLKKQDATTH